MSTDRLGCRKVREGLTEYLDDALPPERRQGFDTHLARCPACRDDLRRLRQTIAALHFLPPETPPPRLKAVLLRNLRQHDGI